MSQNKDGSNVDFASLGGVKQAPYFILKNSPNDVNSSGIFGGAPSSTYNQPTGTNQSAYAGFTPATLPSGDNMNQFFGQPK